MIAKLIKQDVRFQFRHGFYYVYAFVTAIYITVLLFVPLEFRSSWSILIVFTDPGTLGFFFVGAIVMLERNQQLLTYLFITPIKLKSYLWSKILSLTLIAWLTSLFIAYAALETAVSFIWLTIVVLLCSFFFTSCGLIISVDSPSMNHFMFRAIVTMIVLYVPVLNYFDLISFRLVEVMPSYSALFLLEYAMSRAGGIFSLHIPNFSVLIHVGLLTIWGLLAYQIAFGRFSKYILSNTGEVREVSV
ncbi:hypothetical protein [Paucisalibacillus sp. EB02]|uniref:fluoroquinolone export ABC transporter permease subunit n=1 Tax=Paucisalibacillus sp. EB02 TaxID=1347087 RepID=UPI0004B155A8|nr:hypothetical protein [Paucisalibacillus sp. EB02]